jgi:tetraacyldisaccharide 4'-kinase
MSESSAARRWMLPLVPLYRLALGLRELSLRSRLEPVRRLRWPVISVGSLSAGGAGKTPMTIALAKALAARGFSIDVLSRGYGRRSSEAARVRPDGAAGEFGDEPLLIAQQAGVPVFVAPQRFDAGRLAEASDNAGSAPCVHLLDDGFQHRQLARDLDVVLVSRADWRDRLLPAGNLREALRAAERADVAAVPADGPDFERELRQRGWQRPIWRLRRAMDLPRVTGPVAAFCGIARPEQFFAGLEAKGLRLVGRKSFADHYSYNVRDLERIANEAMTAGATALVTTEKDRVRIGALASVIPTTLPLFTAGLRIEIEDEAIDWLAGRLREIARRVSPASR